MVWGRWEKGEPVRAGVGFANAVSSRKELEWTGTASVEWREKEKERYTKRRGSETERKK